LFFSDFFFELWPTAGGGGVDTQRCQRSSGGRDEGKGGKARKKGGMNQTHFVKKEELKVAPLRQIKIISYKDKDQWELCPKYNIGSK
jgi:hypothetical protein